jgi:large conductance mechanosensitive channel
MKILEEFKAFALRGNVVDLAVGIIIGGAFGKIVASLVSDIVMPPIGLLIGGVDFADLKLVLKEGIVDAAGKVIVQPVSINYGTFINTILTFLIIAAAIFGMVKLMSILHKKEEAKAPSGVPTGEEKLLTEIRDILKNK